MAGSGQVVVAIIIDTNSLQNSRGGLKNSPWLGGFMGGSGSIITGGCIQM